NGSGTSAAATFQLQGAGTRTLSTLVNNGLVISSQTTVRFTGDVANNLTFQSNGSDNGFVTLTNGPAAYLQGGKSDRFRFTGDLLSSSTNAARWQTGASALEFQPGATDAHTLSVTGADMGGTTFKGYTNN